MFKKIIAVSFLLSLTTGFSFALSEAESAAQKMIDLWVSNVALQNQQLTKSLTRREAALLLERFAINVLEKQAVKESCSFSDLWVLDLAIAAEVTDSCRLGIFKGNNGKFYPMGKFTRGELIIVIARIVSGNANLELDGAYNYLLGQKVVKVDDRASSSRIAPRSELYIMLARLTDPNFTIENTNNDNNNNQDNIDEDIQDIIDQILNSN
jgi:hypothetical protein